MRWRRPRRLLLRPRPRPGPPKPPQVPPPLPPPSRGSATRLLLLRSLSESDERSPPRGPRGRKEGAAPAPVPGPGLGDPIARHRLLKAAGQLHTVSATFPGCAAEASRELDFDESGRLLRYTRRGTAAGVPFKAELFYDEAGRLSAVRYDSLGRTREVRLGEGADGAGDVPAFVLVPQVATDARLDGAPRCGG